MICKNTILQFQQFCTACCTEPLSGFWDSVQYAVQKTVPVQKTVSVQKRPVLYRITVSVQFSKKCLKTDPVDTLGMGGVKLCVSSYA